MTNKINGINDSELNLIESLQASGYRDQDILVDNDQNLKLDIIKLHDQYIHLTDNNGKEGK